MLNALVLMGYKDVYTRGAQEEKLRTAAVREVEFVAVIVAQVSCLACMPHTALEGTTLQVNCVRQ